MRTNTRLVLPFFYALLISACSNNDNYPKEYIGFEKQFISHTYDTKNEEETITLKIIAAEKQDTDRKGKEIHITCYLSSQRGALAEIFSGYGYPYL